MKCILIPGKGRYAKIKGDLAHRVIYRQHHGLIPKGLMVLHSCSNKRCVNPAHPHLGTHQDNMREGVERGEFPRGEKCHSSKLLTEDVTEIRSLLEGGFSQKKVADMFEISQVAVSKIKLRKSWSHI